MKVLRQDNVSVLTQIELPSNKDIITITTEGYSTTIRTLMSYNGKLNEEYVILRNRDLQKYIEELQYHLNMNVSKTAKSSKYAIGAEPPF